MKEEDILARQSRPQHHSTWIPKTRDWRYATGVFQHDDFEDAPKDRSAWDTLDYDYQVGGNTKNKHGSLSGSGSGSDLGANESTWTLGTPKRARPKVPAEFSTTAIPPETVTKKTKSRTKNVWASVAKYRSVDQLIEGGELVYEAVNLTVRLRFTGNNIASMHRIGEQLSPESATPSTLKSTQSLSTPRSLKLFCGPETPATTRTATTLHTPHILDSIESIHAFPLFRRSWTDETRDFNMKTVRSTIRQPSEQIQDPGSKYRWYTDAVSVDAIFPPGIPLSAKEINAYYPHHVRWKAVMLRLTNNDYRGPDIMGMQAFFRGPPIHEITASQMNNYQRDTVKATLPKFRTTGYKGKPDRNLFMDNHGLGKYLEETLKSFTLPTFDDLLRGLKHLPTGLDARDLTHCLSWYLHIRDSFTPKLDLNVLHTQALIRALRYPLKPFGPQNLDRNALQEWRDTGRFEEAKIPHGKRNPTRKLQEVEQEHRSQMHINLDDDSVKLGLTLPLRHIFTLPFLALHGVAAEALRMGIRKAEARQAEREGEAGRRLLETKWTARLKTSQKTDSEKENNFTTADAARQQEKQDKKKQEKVEVIKKPYRIPKRSRPTEEPPITEPPPKKHTTTHPYPRTPSLPRSQTGPRSGHTPISSPAYANQSFRASGPAHLSRAWSTAAPSSAYAQPQQPHASPYGRRDYQSREPEYDHRAAYRSQNHRQRGEGYFPGGHRR